MQPLAISPSKGRVYMTYLLGSTWEYSGFIIPPPRRWPHGEPVKLMPRQQGVAEIVQKPRAYSFMYSMTELSSGRRSPSLSRSRTCIRPEFATLPCNGIGFNTAGCASWRIGMRMLAACSDRERIAKRSHSAPREDAPKDHTRGQPWLAEMVDAVTTQSAMRRPAARTDRRTRVTAGAGGNSWKMGAS